MRDLHELDEFRHLHPAYGHPGDHGNGYFEMPSPETGETLRIIASNGDDWDHISVSLATRCPTWGEMDHVKRAFFKPHERAMQLHVAEADHISVHPYCLHIWRPRRGRVIPLPPSVMVAP